jgi:drug/metabolite transporter (DMT)-like permease
VGIFSQKAQGETPFIPFSFLMYCFSAIISLPFALRGGLAALIDGSAPSVVNPVVLWLNIAYLGIVAMAFATTVFFLSTARIGASRASSFMFIVPTAALILSWLFLGEVPAAATLIGGALTIAAVYLVNWGSARPAR